jgi:hypothetical protein
MNVRELGNRSRRAWGVRRRLTKILLGRARLFLGCVTDERPDLRKTRIICWVTGKSRVQIALVGRRFLLASKISPHKARRLAQQLRRWADSNSAADVVNSRRCPHPKAVPNLQAPGQTIEQRTRTRKARRQSLRPRRLLLTCYGLPCLRFPDPPFPSHQDETDGTTVTFGRIKFAALLQFRESPVATENSARFPAPIGEPNSGRPAVKPASSQRSNSRPRTFRLFRDDVYSRLRSVSPPMDFNIHELQGNRKARR